MPQSAGGYNIPVSLSSATATSINPILFQPTYFDFQSPGAQAGAGGITSTPTLTPTATSSAAEGNAGSSSQTQGAGGGGFGGGGGGGGLMSGNLLMYLLLGAVAVLGFLYFRK